MFEIASALDSAQCDFAQIKNLMLIWFEQWDNAPDADEKNGWKLEWFVQRQWLYKALIDSEWDKLTAMEHQFEVLTDKAYDIARREKKTQ